MKPNRLNLAHAGKRAYMIANLKLFTKGLLTTIASDFIDYGSSTLTGTKRSSKQIVASSGKRLG